MTVYFSLVTHKKYRYDRPDSFKRGWGGEERRLATTDFCDYREEWRGGEGGCIRGADVNYKDKVISTGWRHEEKRRLHVHTLRARVQHMRTHVLVQNHLLNHKLTRLDAVFTKILTFLDIIRLF